MGMFLFPRETDDLAEKLPSLSPQGDKSKAGMNIAVLLAVLRKHTEINK